MKKVLVTLGFALASLLATGAFAQSKGDVDVEQSKAGASQKATKEEKAAAKAARREVGKSVAKMPTKNEGEPGSDAKTHIPKAERQEAAAKRRASAAALVKQKETIPAGDQPAERKK